MSLSRRNVCLCVWERCVYVNMHKHAQKYAYKYIAIEACTKSCVHCKYKRPRPYTALFPLAFHIPFPTLQWGWRAPCLWQPAGDQSLSNKEGQDCKDFEFRLEESFDPSRSLSLSTEALKCCMLQHCWLHKCSIHTSMLQKSCAFGEKK